MITKLGIGIVTKGQIEAQTACALVGAARILPLPVQMLLAMGPYIHQNRTDIVKYAFQNDCSHLMFIDSDVVFDQFAIKKLIDHNLDIVGGRYNKRILPIESTVKENITELSEVAFVPTGFLLVNMEVFKKIGEPYFFFEDTKDSSEDLWFCQKAIKNGFKIYCDPTISIGHLGTAVF